MAMAFSAQEFSTAAGDLELPGTAMPAEFAAVSQVSDEFASLLDPAALDSPHHDVGLPTAEDASALLATLAAQQGGTQVQVLGGMETAAADPFDPFQQHGKT
jgi:hypothetical protein